MVRRQNKGPMMDFQVVGTLIGNLGIGAILAWYLWYTTSIQQPRQNAAQNEIVRSIVDGFRADMTVERDHRNGLCDAVRELTAEMKQRPCLARQQQQVEPLSTL